MVALHPLPRLPAALAALDLVEGPRELVELYPSLIPSDPTLENYRTAFTENDLVQRGVEQLEDRDRDRAPDTVIGASGRLRPRPARGVISRIGIGWILLSQMFPLILIIIPLFLLLRDLQLTDTHAASSSSTSSGRCRSSSGCCRATSAGSRATSRRRRRSTAPRASRCCGIVAPLLLPGIVVTTLFAFIQAWNEFFFALVLLQTPDLRRCRSGSRSSSASRESSGSARWPRAPCSRPCRASFSSRSSSAG